ncbi:prepilin peptidase [Micromonospora endolithica]|uniref:Prepilin peptidase n=1 Tax=Micromonospora endolithica TaxID=230091 RepID=A0A3A9ZEE5_9ACTN|nr:A24 family peptidase [Micromonospora endolithica]RKN46485.1 prepilin peptidase [Micromonospora endolithica]TWJ25041.1 leader peptidase (prepilin peptidase)/N-methyltransferase [Micromonospora endolithica]
MLLPLVAVATLAGAGWGLLVPGLVDRYAVEWPDGTPQPPWRTACPHCDAPRPPWWRAARRCAGCADRRWPGPALTVPLSAATWGVLAYAVGPSPVLPAFLLLAALAVPLALVDLRVLRLPDPLVLTAFVGGVVLLSAAALAERSVTLLIRPGVAAVTCGVVYLTVALLPRSQLGFGDVKLGAVLGLFLGWLGWPAVVAGGLLAPLVNLPLVIGLLIVRRAGRRTLVPYGPAMLLAALVAVLLSTPG